MKKSEIRLLIELSKGKREMKDLALALNASKGFLSRLLQNLIKKNLVEKIKEGRKYYYKVLDTPKSILILRTILFNPKILKGKREILLPFLIEKNSLKDLQIKTGISLKQLLEYLKEFQSFGIVLKENNFYFLNPRKEDVINLARILRVEMEKEEFVWKRGEEYLKFSDKEEKGLSLTAFSIFPKFSIKIIPDKFYYYHPKKELGIEEVFVHSLAFSSTKQQTFLSMIFYLKNRERIDLEKVFFLAKKYKVKEFLQKIFDYLDGKEVKDERFLGFEEFKEKAKVYGIEIEEKKTEKEKLMEFLRQLDKKLLRKIEIYLIGGANMVLRDLKISTKGIDLIVERKYYKILKDALISLGFSFSLNIFESKDYRVDVFVRRVLRGYYLSDRIKRVSEVFIELKNLRVMMVPLEYLFLFKSYSGREIDVEDCKILAEKGLDWKAILKESLLQEKELKKFLSLSLLDLLNELSSRYGIKPAIMRALNRHCMKKLIEFSLAKKEKTVKELLFKLERPESSVRKILNEMVREGKIKKFKRGKILYFKKV